MKVIGKVEVDKKHLTDPTNNGMVKGKVAVDLKIIDGNGHELNSDEVIEQGFAGKARFGLKNAAGEEVVLFAGKGAKTDAAGKVKRFTSGAAKGKAIFAETTSSRAGRGPRQRARHHAPSSGSRGTSTGREAPTRCLLLPLPPRRGRAGMAPCCLPVAAPGSHRRRGRTSHPWGWALAQADQPGSLA